MNDLTHDMLAAAEKAAKDNVRHSKDSLYMLIGEWFPEASDEEVEAVVNATL